ncbi:hypothetical protein SK128_008781 [Halocaridina rubra]|uniref:Uncharacterized protein n=1 Tax=Halocaridina rubra TaxID=373956 RepID=A0AAN8X9T9_HALRR
MDRKLTLAIILFILGLAYKALPNGALDPEGGKSKRSEGSFTYHKSDAKDFQEFLLRLEKLGLIKNPGRFRNWDDEELRGFGSGSGDGSGEGSGDCGPYDSQDCLGSENGSGKCGPIDSEDCEGSGDGSGSYVSESSEDQGSRTEGSAGPLPTSSDDEDFYYALKGLSYQNMTENFAQFSLL